MAHHAVRLAVAMMEGRRRSEGHEVVLEPNAHGPRHHGHPAKIRREDGLAVDERRVEVVAGRPVHVAAVLDDAARVVERRAVHDQQRRLRLLVEETRLLAVGDLRADALAGQPDVDTARPKGLIEPARSNSSRSGASAAGR